jgi:hypothetical protein
MGCFPAKTTAVLVLELLIPRQLSAVRTLARFRLRIAASRPVLEVFRLETGSLLGPRAGRGYELW